MTVILVTVSMVEEKAFQLVGGHVALDFVNTLDYPNEGELADEALRGYADVLRFAEATGLFSPGRRRALQKSVSHTQQAKALRMGLTLREYMRELFGAAAQERMVAQPVLDGFNDYLGQALRHRQLQRNGKELTWSWDEQPDDAGAPFWPIVLAAAELLASPQRKLVRQCANGTCGWLFLDTSKNHSRRWCEMKTCGNRVKARNHYQKIRTALEEQL